MTENRKLVEPYDPYLYDLIHRGYADDVNFYRRACRDTSKVLELGCGSGRIALELAREGFAVIGLDNHRGMLKLLETHRLKLTDGRGNIKLIAADMTDFKLNKRFDRIIIPFNSLFCLQSDRAVIRCFSRVASHLTDHGRLVFDVYRVDPDDDLQESLSDQFEWLTEVVDQDRHIAVFERHLVDASQQRIDAEYLYQINTGNTDMEEVVCRIPHRYLFAQEIEQLLAQAGLKTRDIKGGFRDEPVDEDCQILVIEAEKIS